MISDENAKDRTRIDYKKEYACKRAIDARDDIKELVSGPLISCEMFRKIQEILDLNQDYTNMFGKQK